MEKKQKKTQKFTVIWSAVLAVLLILCIVVNVVLTVPLYTVMNMYFGKGEAVITNDTSVDVDTEYYKSDYTDGEEMFAASKSLAAEIESEGIVLLKNDNQALPLTTDDLNVSLFGRTSVDPIYTGAGSAATESSPVNYKTALENHGFSVNTALYDFYANHTISTTPVKETMQTGMGPVDVEYTGRGFISAMGTALFTGDIIAEVPVADYPETLTDTYKEYNGAAVVFIGRVGGEGCDLPTDMSEFATRDEDKEKTYLELNSIEKEMLSYVKEQKDAGTFDKIIVVCNTANALELGFLEDENYGIDAAIWVGCVGDQGAEGVVAVLDGEVSPSGRLIDTYVYDLTKDPSYQNFEDIYYSNVDGNIGGYESGCFNEYEEGIYVGYRYYETAAAEAEAGNYEGFDYDAEVQYPFGYGLSYTNFTMEFAGEPVYQDGQFTFDVIVTNTGDVPGKQVVQIYAETPYTAGGIEKAKVVLAAFDKTEVLEPGESESLTLTVTEDDLASYDYKNNGCYILDAGVYKFYLSENAHSWNIISTEDAAQYMGISLDEVIYNGENARVSDLVTATNQFDEVSAVFTEEAVEGSPRNMSRADFAGTFPTAPTERDIVADESIKTALETTFSENEDVLLGNVEGSAVYTDSMPATGESNGIDLIDLRGADYNDENWNLLLDQLDMSQVANMLANAGFNTAELLNIGKTATLDYDGPMGWSTWVSADGSDAICLGFPAEEMLAATWNEDLAYEMGLMIGEQGLYNGFNGWYAPGMNTHRSAFGGRNYEYYSEDGFLAGTLAAQEVSGAMEKGVYSYLKHFALNDKEDGRNGMAVFANEQAIREIYLKPFELCIKNAKATIYYNDTETNQMISKEIQAATAIMSSYNRIGTKWTGATYGLMTQILRNEWGFEGMSLSDYFGGSAYMDSDEGLRAGNDMLLNTFADGSLTDASSATAVNAMRNAAHHVLYTVANSNAMQGVASGVTITYKLAMWQKALIAGDVVVGIVVIFGVVLLVRKSKKAIISVSEE